MKTQYVLAKNELSSNFKKSMAHIVFCVYENLNKQFLSVISEMILSDEKNLETLVVDELEIAIQAAKSSLAEKLEAETLETISQLIEQQINPESFESTSYSIDLPGYSSSSYDASKYYDMLQGEDGKTSALVSGTTDYQHEFLQEAQQIASQVRQGDTSNHPFVEAQIDTNIKYIKESIKLVSPALWKLMYEGKIIFN